jgi:hypothetical protein
LRLTSGRFQKFRECTLIFIPMLGKPIELSPDVAGAFLSTLYLFGENTIEADAIAVRQVQLIREYPELREKKHRPSE